MSRHPVAGDITMRTFDGLFIVNPFVVPQIFSAQKSFSAFITQEAWKKHMNEIASMRESAEEIRNVD